MQLTEEDIDFMFGLPAGLGPIEKQAQELEKAFTKFEKNSALRIRELDIMLVELGDSVKGAAGEVRRREGSNADMKADAGIFGGTDAESSTPLRVVLVEGQLVLVAEQQEVCGEEEEGNSVTQETETDGATPQAGLFSDGGEKGRQVWDPGTILLWRNEALLRTSGYARDRRGALPDCRGAYCGKAFAKGLCWTAGEHC